MKDVRLRAAKLVTEITGDAKYKDVTGDTPKADVNYVFPTFVTTRMPIGLVGLIIAAIFAAAMSSIAAELNSLATATVIDVYRRLLKPSPPTRTTCGCRSWVTFAWGLVACAVASVAVQLGSLIEVVNRFGSFFYGSLLGVFVLALGVQARHRHRRVRRPARGYRRRVRIRIASRHQGRLVPLAQSARRHHRRRRRPRGEPDDAHLRQGYGGQPQPAKS